MPASKDLLKAIAVTAELTGTQLTAAAARVLADDLSLYPEDQVMGALSRCRKELKGRLVVAEIIARLADGRPGPEEAWSMIPRDEAATVVWTDEMRTAWGVALPLLNEGDGVAARMAFLEQYRAAVLQARDAGKLVRWEPSLGHDPHSRQSALLDAAEKGRLTAEHVASLLPNLEEAPPRLQALIESRSVKAIEA